MGATSAHYHEELDARVKLALYRQWERTGDGGHQSIWNGINSGIDRHVIRNGVPPNINTWVQELGREGWTEWAGSYSNNILR